MPTKRYHCKTCNFTVDPIKKQRGSLLLQFLLFLIFIIPGIIYTIWRFKGYKLVCPRCKKSNLVEIVKREKPKPSPPPKPRAPSKQKTEKPKSAPVTKEIGIREELPIKCPSVDEFLNYYYKGDYHKAIGVSRNASPQEIRDAIDLFEIEHSDRSGEWGTHLAKIKEALLNSANAEKLGKEEVIEINPWLRREAESILNEAALLYDEGKLDKALEMCNKALEVDSTFLGTYMLKGDICKIKGRLDPSFLNEGIENYNKAIEVEPYDPNLYLGLADCHALKGELKKAIETYNKGIEMNPSDLSLILSKIEVQIWNRQYEDAVGTYGTHREKFSLSKEYNLVATWLVCIALSLAGEPLGNYVDPLLDKGLKIDNIWNTADIEPYLNKLAEDNVAPERIVQALKIHSLFKEHFINQ